MANFVPMDRGGQPLPTYDLMGLGRVPTLTRVFGGAPFYTQSGILQGINSQITEQIRNRVVMFGTCVRSQDDTTANPMAINGVLQKLGVNGAYIPHTGTNSTASVGYHQAALIPIDGPLRVNNFNALTSSLGFSRNLASLSNPQKEKLTKLIQTLNESQARKLAQESNVSSLSQFVGCASKQNTEVINAGSNLVDPRQNAAFSAVWNIQSNTPNEAGANFDSSNDLKSGQGNLLFASLVYNTLTKNSGSTTLVLGGYDYHGQSRPQTDEADRVVGRLIGRVLSSASTLNTPVFIIVTADGSVSSQQSDSAGSMFNSDRGLAGVLYSFIYHPNREIVLKKNQLGHFEAGQSAAENSTVGSTTERAMAAILVNYLALHNRVGDLDILLGSRIFTMRELDEIILINS